MLNSVNNLNVNLKYHLTPKIINVIRLRKLYTFILKFKDQNILKFEIKTIMCC